MGNTIPSPLAVEITYNRPGKKPGEIFEKGVRFLGGNAVQARRMERLQVVNLK